jgi:hypothetical protein
MRSFRSPNSGQTALTLQHSTSPRSGYRPPVGHNADGYTMAQRVGFKRGGSAQQKLIKAKQERAAKEKDRHRRALKLFNMKIAHEGGNIKKEGHPELRKAGFKKGGWIQDVNKSIKKRGTKGKCTPITKKGCTGRAKALAKTFKKMAKKRKGK